MSVLHGIRAGVAAITQRLPLVRGLGRIVLFANKRLTNENDPASCSVVSQVNGRCRLRLDLRSREQMFAFYYGRWEQPLIEAVARHFTRGVFYDIGASIGLYAMHFGRICRERGTYLRAFEPVPANLERLRSQFALNDMSDAFVKIEPVALGDTPGTAKLTLVDGGRPGNAKITSSGDIEVEVTTLDTVWEQNGRESVGFIKIDTEGWDARILDGARQLIETCRPNLLVEFNRERMRNLSIPIDKIWRYLTDELQYACFRIDDAGCEHSLTSPGEWENLLFIATEKSERTPSSEAALTLRPVSTT